MLSAESIRKKFDSIEPTQEKIETVSLWCLHHKDHAVLIASAWLQSYKNANEKTSLSLVYLANDVCQKCRKKKGTDFLSAFAPMLKEAFTIIPSDSFRQSVLRVVKIWDERRVFEADIIKGFMNNLQSSSGTAVSNTGLERQPTAAINIDIEKTISDFRLASVISEMEKYEKQAENRRRLRALLPVSAMVFDSNVKALLKNRQEGQKYVEDFHQAQRKLTEFVEEFENTLKRHSQLVESLEQARIFYDTQLKEVSIVETAYAKFAAGVKAVAEQLNASKTAGGKGHEPSTSGIKRDIDKFETIDMDLDDEVKFSQISHANLYGNAQESNIAGMKLATNQSFLNQPPTTTASNGDNNNYGSPAKKFKPESQNTTVYPPPLIPETGTFAAKSEYSPPVTWQPPPAIPQHVNYSYTPTSIQPPPAYVPTASQVNLPPPYLGGPPPSPYSPTAPLLRPNFVSPPPQRYENFATPYRGGRQPEESIVFDYDHGSTSEQAPLNTQTLAANRGSNMNNLTVLSAGGVEPNAKTSLMSFPDDRRHQQQQQNFYAAQTAVDHQYYDPTPVRSPPYRGGRGGRRFKRGNRRY